jgi:CobQ-like glutamine amidotransferase family enzyme
MNKSYITAERPRIDHKNSIVIAHLYPREMNIYGDMGNIIALRRRLELRGYSVEVKAVEIGDHFDFSKVDFVFGGGGQDSGQSVIASDLATRRETLQMLANDGLPMLTICGMYQLFGRGFTTVEGRDLIGIGVFKAITRGSTIRMIGNIVIQSKFGQLVGFENHSGQTVLEEGQEALGTVKKGFGNNNNSGCEGAITNNVIGTYMHGPLLPKNPQLTDHLLLVALRRKFGVEKLKHIDSELEMRAALAASRRPQ